MSLKVEFPEDDVRDTTLGKLCSGELFTKMCDHKRLGMVLNDNGRMPQKRVDDWAIVWLDTGDLSSLPTQESVRRQKATLKVEP